MAVDKQLSLGDDQQNIAQANQNFKQIQHQLNTHVVKDSTGTSRVLIGRQKGQAGRDEFTGMKVSQPGFDVTTASSDQLVMSSDFNMFKIVDSGEVTLTGGATDGAVYTETVTHNLGYRPMVLAQVKLPAALGGDTTPLPTTFHQYGVPVAGQLTPRVIVNMSIDDSEIIFFMIHDSVINAENFVIKYYIVRETGVSL